MLAAGSRVPPADPGQDERPTICVVDDDASVLRALSRLLRAAGFRVETFPGPEELLASPVLETARCLVLDIRLARQSGFALHEDLAAAGHRVPVIFMTAHDSPPARERARRAGAVAYLRKPFADHVLLEAIERALGRGRGA